MNTRPRNRSSRNLPAAGAHPLPPPAARHAAVIRGGAGAVVGTGPLAPPAARRTLRLAAGALACTLLGACTLRHEPPSDYLGFVQEAMAEAARVESGRTRNAASAIAAAEAWRRGESAEPAGRAGRAEPARAAR